MDEYAEEDIRIDPSAMDSAFKRGLQRSGVQYLEELKKMATNDYELEGEGEAITMCFDGLIKYVTTRGKNVGAFQLKDLKEFGLSADVVSRIGFLAFQLDTMSPRSSQNNNSRRGFESKQMSEEFYDDDFEDIEEDTHTPGGMYLGSSDELYIEKASPTKGPAGNRYAPQPNTRPGFDGEASSDLEDIEDETYDVRKDFRKNVAVQGTPPPNRVTAPRISPEVNFAQNARSANTRDPPAVPALKPSVVASVNFMPVAKTSTGLARTTETDSPGGPQSSSSGMGTGIADSASKNRASTAGTVNGKRASRTSRSGRIKTATWIETHSWRLGEKIGAGAFGEVFKGLNDKVRSCSVVLQLIC